MNRTLLIGAAASAALLLAGSYGLSPFVAAYSFKGADETKLAKLVDFDQVRENLRTRLKAAVVNDPELADNPFAGLAMALTEGVINTAVEAYANPTMLAKVVRGVKADDVRYKYGYTDLDTFNVAITRDSDPSVDIRVVFDRSGLFDWRVVDVIIPEGL